MNVAVHLRAEQSEESKRRAFLAYRQALLAHMDKESRSVTRGPSQEFAARSKKSEALTFITARGEISGFRIEFDDHNRLHLQVGSDVIYVQYALGKPISFRTSL